MQNGLLGQADVTKPSDRLLGATQPEPVRPESANPHSNKSVEESPIGDLARLIDAERKLLEAHLDNVATMQAALGRLAIGYFAAGDSPADVTLLGSADTPVDLAQTCETFFLASRSEIRALRGAVFHIPYAFDRQFHRASSALARGVTMRAVYTQSWTRSAAGAAYLRKLAGAGAQVRISPSVPLDVAIADDSLTLAVNPGDDGSSVRFFRDAHIAHMAAQMFEYLWINSIEYGPAADEPVCEISDQQISILRSMANGLKDEAVARSHHMSTRTLRRIISDLATVLGVESRFQVGMKAAELGLLASIQMLQPKIV